MDLRERERLHHSLPVLDVEYLPEIRHKPQPQKQKKRRQLEDEVLTSIVSAFYAKLLVIIGMAFSITRSITMRGSEQHDIYFIYLYIVSVIFLLYVYTIHMRTKSILYEINNGQHKDASEFLVNCRRNMYTRYGSFYFRMGVVGFGIGSLIFSALQFGQYFEFSNQPGCPTVIRAIKPAARISFILLQMLFIFSFSNFLDVQRSQLISKFGLMHLVATNVSDWFQVLVESTVHDLFSSIATQQTPKYILNPGNITRIDGESRLLEVTRSQWEQKQTCIKFQLITTILSRVEPHLASCAVEYNLLCSMILVLMWKNSTSSKTQGIF
ncbi:unnamed protein product [Psylliodes chrysocephalus]|uniref:Uncharacterized protein n=1 Tax=Psylliodes chrysocephalus TaxID=3402493 RepID=A0A9P0D557_9CUCU|nr:unnamed protein product [Psylliodes chrysocephala]